MLAASACELCTEGGDGMILAANAGDLCTEGGAGMMLAASACALCTEGGDGMPARSPLILLVQRAQPSLRSVLFPLMALTTLMLLQHPPRCPGMPHHLTASRSWWAGGHLLASGFTVRRPSVWHHPSIA